MEEIQQEQPRNLTKRRAGGGVKDFEKNEMKRQKFSAEDFEEPEHHKK